VTKDLKVFKEHDVRHDNKDNKDHKDHKDHFVFKASKVFKARRVKMASMKLIANQTFKVNPVLR
jgi:hypothetical protein